MEGDDSVKSGNEAGEGQQELPLPFGTRTMGAMEEWAQGSPYPNPPRMGWAKIVVEKGGGLYPVIMSQNLQIQKREELKSHKHAQTTNEQWMLYNYKQADQK